MKKFVRIIYTHGLWARNHITEVLDGGDDDHSLAWHVPGSTMSIDKNKSVLIDAKATYVQLTRQYSDHWEGDRLGEVFKVVSTGDVVYVLEGPNSLTIPKDHAAVVYSPEKEPVSKYQKMRFHPKDVEESTHIQHKLFEMGYFWPGSVRGEARHSKLQHVGAKFLITNTKGDILYADKLSEQNMIDYPRYFVDVVTTHTRTLRKEATTLFNGKEYPTDWLQSLIDNAVSAAAQKEKAPSK